MAQRGTRQDVVAARKKRHIASVTEARADSRRQLDARHATANDRHAHRSGTAARRCNTQRRLAALHILSMHASMRARQGEPS